MSRIRNFDDVSAIEMHELNELRASLDAAKTVLSTSTSAQDRLKNQEKVAEISRKLEVAMQRP